MNTLQVTPEALSPQLPLPAYERLRRAIIAYGVELELRKDFGVHVARGVRFCTNPSTIEVHRPEPPAGPGGFDHYEQHRCGRCAGCEVHAALKALAEESRP